MAPQPRSHCHACGKRYTPEVLASGNPHRACAAPEAGGCGTVAWANPTPIAVMLQPVYQFLRDYDSQFPRPRVGILIGQRGIAPKLGEWGLPGGFVDIGDSSYEAAAARERGEEVDLGAPWGGAEPVLRYSRPGDPGQIIAFAEAHEAIHVSTLASFRPCAECPAVRVAWQAEQLCFESHSYALARWHSSRADKHSRDPHLLDVNKHREDWFAAQKAWRNKCPHQWQSADDLYNHHTREEYERCAKCGATR